VIVYFKHVFNHGDMSYVFSVLSVIYFTHSTRYSHVLSTQCTDTCTHIIHAVNNLQRTQILHWR